MFSSEMCEHIDIPFPVYTIDDFRLSSRLIESLRRLLDKRISLFFFSKFLHMDIEILIFSVNALYNYYICTCEYYCSKLYLK